MKKIKALSVSLFICAVLCVFFAVNASAANYPDSISGTMRDTSSSDNGTVKWLFEYDERSYSARLTLSGDGYMPNYTDDSWYIAQEETGCWITELVIEEGIKSISESAFEGEIYLTSVELPDSVEYIGEYAFYDTGITSVNIPSRVQNLNGTMFPSDCICNYYVDENNPYLTSVDGVVYSKDMSVLKVFPVGRYTENRSYIFNIPESVTEIATYAFMNGDAGSITVPSNVKTISNQAFIGNVYLTDLTIENGVEYIYDSAFLSCTSLKEVTIPESVKYIGYMAFGYIAAIDYASIEAMLDQKEISHPELNEYNVVFYVGYTGFPIDSFVYWVPADDFVIHASDNTAGASYILRNSKPVVKAADEAYGGIEFSWEPLKYADGYYIYRKTGKNGPWQIIGKVDGQNTVSFLDKTASPKVTYYYSVSAFDSLGAMSDFDDNGVSAIYYLKAPAVNSLSNVAGGVTVKWSSVSGAEAYYVYRKASTASKYSYIGYTSSTSYTDKTVKNGVTYTYTVLASDGDNLSANKESGWSIKYIATPTLSSATNVSGGVTVTWKAVSGADSYRVYRKTSSSGWTCLNKKVTGTSYTDTTAKSGTTYYYTVKAENEAGVSGYNKTGISVKYLAMPTVTVANAATGVKVSWNKITGASKYYVYRKASSEKSWTRLTDSATGTSYTDTKAKSGTTYYYTVKAVSGSVASAFKSSSALKYLAQPKVSSLSNANSGITVKWNKITGAKGYTVYRKASGDKSWTNLGNTTGTSFTDTKAKAGTTYYYTVRAYNGSVKSTYTSSTAVRRLTTPTLKSVTSAKSGITFKWNKVTGAEGYYVYRKTGSGDWKKIATVKSGSTVSYLDKTAKKGTTYTYTVRAYYGSSVSYFNTTGLKIKDKY